MGIVTDVHGYSFTILKPPDHLCVSEGVILYRSIAVSIWTWFLMLQDLHDDVDELEDYACER